MIITTTEARSCFNGGVEASSAVLQATMEDLEQRLPERIAEMARTRKSMQLGWQKMLSDIQLDQEKVQLLKGQIFHIRKLSIK